MSSYEEILKGGKSEHSTLKPGSTAESEIYRRVMLPELDEDHMPPEGKVPLTKEEISLLEWWIEKGAEPSLKRYLMTLLLKVVKSIISLYNHFNG